MLTKRHDLALGAPTWLRTHEHMLLNCPPIWLQAFRGAAHHHKGSNAKLSSPIDRLSVAERGRLLKADDSFLRPKYTGELERGLGRSLSMVTQMAF